MRERGLKQLQTASRAVNTIVAPYAGAWIETAVEVDNPNLTAVSLPTRERGLKPLLVLVVEAGNCRRSLRGSVD